MKLDHRHRRAIEALVSGANVTQAAAVAGVSRRTLYRWKTEEKAFKAELQRLGNEAMTDAAVRLKGSMSVAVDLLRAVMLDEEENTANRIRAAQVTIDAGLRLVEATEILQRLEALERGNR